MNDYAKYYDEFREEFEDLLPTTEAMLWGLLSEYAEDRGLPLEWIKWAHEANT